jgi:hypothetical protein
VKPGAILPSKPNALREIFGVPKAIIGMIHLKPLPGAPHFTGGNLHPVLEAALADADALYEGGVDGLIVENAWDLPFSKPEDIGFETVAAMSVIVDRIIQHSKLPVGINILANGAIQSLAVARATGARFVRVNQWVNAYVANEGFIEGPSAKALRYRTFIKGDDIKIFADVHVKHGAHAIVADRSVPEQTRDAVFFDADVLIATGQRTGDETPVEEVTSIQSATLLPVIVGSGLSTQNASALMEKADGAIIGSSIKYDELWWNPVEVERVRKLMAVVREVRKHSA